MAKLSPRQGLVRLSSLDHILQHRESLLADSRPTTKDSSRAPSTFPVSGICTPYEGHKSFKAPLVTVLSIEEPRGKPFRCLAAEVCFCACMILSQLISEYLISGFAVLWPTLAEHYGDTSALNLWPGTMLSLTLCATILIFARLADGLGGYPIFMFGVAWIAIWSLAAGFAPSTSVLTICRAMQGLACAAFEPACVALIGTVYPGGRRKNMVLGLYSAACPLGFFAGSAISASFPATRWPWFFWIPAIIAVIILPLAYLSIPADRPNYKRADLNMDWFGAATITPGVILVVYALSNSANVGWKSPATLVPLCIGMLFLTLAVYIEGWVAKSPLIPFAFFKPASVKPFILATLFFYACFGNWLFTTTQVFEIFYGYKDVKLALAFLPDAIGGVIFTIVGSALLTSIPPTMVLIFSGLAWIGAPLFMALADPAKGYWPLPFPSTIAATAGVDLTFTIANVFLTASQPEEYQGLAGAVACLSFNLAIAFGLALCQIVQTAVAQGNGSAIAVAASLLEPTPGLLETEHAAYWLAVASAAIGLMIVLAFVRIPSSVCDEVATAAVEEDTIAFAEKTGVVVRMDAIWDPEPALYELPG